MIVLMRLRLFIFSGTGGSSHDFAEVALACLVAIDRPLANNAACAICRTRSVQIFFCASHALANLFSSVSICARAHGKEPLPHGAVCHLRPHFLLRRPHGRHAASGWNFGVEEVFCILRSVAYEVLQTTFHSLQGARAMTMDIGLWPTSQSMRYLEKC